MKVPVWLFVALLSILSASTGQVLLKIGVSALPSNPLKNPAELLIAFLNPFVVAGVLAFALSMVLWLGAISGQQLSSVYPLAALGYVVVSVASVWLFRDTMGALKIAGIMLIVLGTIVLNAGNSAFVAHTGE